MNGKKARQLRKAAQELTYALNDANKAAAGEDQTPQVLPYLGYKETNQKSKIKHFIQPFQVNTGEKQLEVINKETKEVLLVPLDDGVAYVDEKYDVKEVPLMLDIRGRRKGDPFRSPQEGTPSAVQIQTHTVEMEECTRKMYQNSKKVYREVAHA